MPEKLVVIGADAGGMTAASQARKLRDSSDLEIVAFEKGNYSSYSACGIPYFVGGVVKFDDLIVRGPAEFAEQDIDVRLRHEVIALDLDSRKITVRDLESGDELTEGFDQLLIATGGKPVRPDLPGSDAKGIFGVQILDDGAAIGKVLAEEDPKRAVIVGGGYIGLEMAEAFTLRGIEVALVERASHPMTTLDPDMGALVADAISGLGVALYTNEAVEAFEQDGDRVTGVVTERRTLPADIVVLGLGVRPNVKVAQAAGVEIGPSGGIVVDQRMRTGSDGVWAAGDCAEKYHRVPRKPVSIALGTHANKEGRVVGINLGGGYATFPGVLGTAVAKVCGYEVARTGLNESQAADAGFSSLSVLVESTTRAGYYPGATEIKTKLIAEERSGRLLGAQIIGEEGAAKRIDVLATALWNEMSVADLLNVDLSYAPPFAPVWDPVVIAARKAWQKVEETTIRDEN